MQTGINSQSKFVLCTFSILACCQPVLTVKDEEKTSKPSGHQPSSNPQSTKYKYTRKNLFRSSHVAFQLRPGIHGHLRVERTERSPEQLNQESSLFGCPGHTPLNVAQSVCKSKDQKNR